MLRLRDEHLRMNGWKPCKSFTIVNWCAYVQQLIRGGKRDGYWTLVPILRSPFAS